MVTGGISCVPVFPSSAFDMVSDPGRISPAQSNSKRWFNMAPTTSTVKASTINIISGLNTYLQRSLSTLHASISTDYARLVSGGWLLLTRQDCIPCREMLRCFIPFSILKRLRNPHLTGLSQRDGVRHSLFDILCLITGWPLSTN